MMTFTTMLEYVPKRTPVSEETITEPDLTYSVEELFDRMVQGLPLSKGNIIPTYYDDDEDIDNPDITQRPGFELSDYTEEMLKLEQDVAERRMNEVKSNPPSEANKDADQTE